MSSSAENAAEGSPPTSGNPSTHRQHRSGRQQAPTALASASDSFLNFPFTFEQSLDDAVAASFRIEADVCIAP
jgi:hypothetical protein